MSKTAVKDYIKNISKLNPYEYYKELICDKDLFRSVSSAIKNVSFEILEYTRNYTESILNSGYVDVEDLAPIIYLKYKIHDIEEKISVKHIVIDEAQDFSPFQFYVLKKIIKDSSFTILGDLCQGINSYRGTSNWNDVKSMAFEGADCDIVTLETSYRTTVEIMNSANKVIKKLNDTNLVLGKPVIRHGEEQKY
jgi:DNA helicase-2/ATP-dependent DNA helicase PcrA